MSKSLIQLNLPTIASGKLKSMAFGLLLGAAMPTSREGKQLL
jgi:hypothetical protein